MSKNLRIGAVSYLNAKPLIEGIPLDQLTLLPPRNLAEEFEKGSLDVALLPTYYLLQNQNLRAVRGLGIGCEGTVYSVFIKPVSPEITSFQTLQASPESMTSNRLAEVILRKYQKINFTWKDKEAEGEVIIGDLAFSFKAANPTYPLIDLGDAWWNAVELPFVFALWVIHPRVSKEEAQQAATLLQNSWNLGKAKIATYAKTPMEFQYLAHYLRFEHDSRFEKGIQQWQSDLIEIGLLSTQNTWQWI
ncbi:MAG: MqnA/MqnD/SBP family protein [Verrucomicrobiota bacterium]